MLLRTKVSLGGCRFVTRSLSIAIGLGIAVSTIAVGTQKHPAQPHAHPELKPLNNPIESTTDSRRIGRQRYVFMCRECHGNFGKGDGDMSHAGGVPADFTDDVWQHGESDGEIFTVIREGVTADMQGYSNRLSDDDIWHLVNYLRSLSE